MKKRNIVILSLLMLTAFMADAQTVMVSEVTASATDEMEIKIETGTGISNYIATGFYLELPEGFSVVGAEGVKADNVQSNHIVRIGAVGDNKLRVAIYSLSNSQFGISGSSSRLPLCTIKLKAPNKHGSFTGRLTGIELVSISHSLVRNDAQTFNIQLQSLSKGDVNGDGSVDIADAVCIVNYVVGKPNTTFIEAAADANGDGDIDIADAVHIVNYVVGKISALAPRFEWNIPEPE